MSTTEEDNKYNSLRAKLKSMPKLNAKADFNDKLFARIRETERNMASAKRPVETERGKSVLDWLGGLFRPSFIPAIGLTVVLLAAIVVYFGYFSQGKSTKNDTMSYNSAPTDKGGEFVIYVRKDKEPSEYPQHEIASLEQDERTGPGTTTKQIAPVTTESPTDRFATPKIESPEIRLDKVSEEQKFEMERSEKKQPMKKGDVDDSKTYEKKEYKMERKAPSNYIREKSDETTKDNDGIINQEVQPEGKLSNKAIEEDKENKTEDTIKSGTDSQTTGDKITSKSVKDSLKTKKSKIDSESKDTNKK